MTVPLTPDNTSLLGGASWYLEDPQREKSKLRGLVQFLSLDHVHVGSCFKLDLVSCSDQASLPINSNSFQNYKKREKKKKKEFFSTLVMLREGNFPASSLTASSSSSGTNNSFTVLMIVEGKTSWKYKETIIEHQYKRTM